MVRETNVVEVAHALRISIGLLKRRLRQTRFDGELTLPETSALARLERGGATTATELAKREQISPQSMGATLAALEGRGLIARGPDPADGRRAVIALTESGASALRNLRSEMTDQLARGLSTGFTSAELRTLMAVAPLLERLAENI
jgi:DNA-binding MarR family transcriptional regulator